MTWLSVYSTPNLKDAEFQPEANCIDLIHDASQQKSRIWTHRIWDHHKSDPLVFLYRLRHAVNEAIKLNLELDNQKIKEEN